ncbi:vezatin [Aplochiton taeniatus]
MTEEFDEEVVFENSPLFHYLQDLGHTDFEACPTVSEEEDCGGVEGDNSNQDVHPKPLGRGLWRLADTLWRKSPFHQATASQQLEQQLQDRVFCQYSVQCILEQDVLLQEDVELIELLDPSLLTLGSSSSGSPSGTSTLPTPRFLASPSLWDMAVLVGLASVLLGLSSTSGSVLSLAAAPWMVVVMGWVVLKGAALWRQGQMQRAVHRRAAELQSLVQNSKTLTSLARKSLRLVQETEVISRGFTLVSAATSFSRAGAGPRGQQLIGLRKAVYRALRTAFRSSRRATCHMLNTYPLNSEIDNVTNYVCAVPLKELGLGLGTEHLNDEQAQELTDDFSLPALKVLFQLWVGQSSECFRRLALLLSPQRVDEPGEAPASSPPPLHSSIVVITEPLHNALASCLGEVHRSYDFHRYFETQLRSQGSDMVRRSQDKCKELNTLHTSVRSLQLHLKALLSEMIILEDDLEKLMVSKEPVEVTCEGYQDLSDRLHQLQPHMQASTNCWDDTLSQVERMLRRANNCSGPPDGQEQFGLPVPCTPPSPPSYTLILDRDPVPEEQELEAYVSDSDSDGEWQGSMCDMLSPEERERQRREREESRRVLSELKAVLGLRASEGERRKWKQMLFNDQAALLPLVSGEHSETQPASEPLEAPASVDVAELTVGVALHLSEQVKEETKEESRGRVESSPAATEKTAEAVTEFSCGQVIDTGEGGDTSALDETGGPQLYQYDGLPGEGVGQNGLDCLLRSRVPALSVMDRLTEIHGSATLSFSSAIASQVAARSHIFANMEEQTFGDEGEAEEEEDEEEGEKDFPT